MVFGISPTEKMKTMGTSKVIKRDKYSFLRLAGATMITNISKELILTPVRPSGDPN